MAGEAASNRAFAVASLLDWLGTSWSRFVVLLLINVP
jgi:hypothetical protein